MLYEGRIVKRAQKDQKVTVKGDNNEVSLKADKVREELLFSKNDIMAKNDEDARLQLTLAGAKEIDNLQTLIEDEEVDLLVRPFRG